MHIPKLIEAIRQAETILSETLMGEVKIKTYHANSTEIIKAIISIDSAKFRKELQYDEEELKQRISKPGFFCIVAYLDDEPVGFDYGYDEEDGVFFSDSEATMIERKGIGRILGILELLYLYEKRYQSLKFTTEEMDESGRPLREIWEKQGYMVAERYPDGGVDMMLEINQQVVAERVQKNLR